MPLLNHGCSFCTFTNDYNILSSYYYYYYCYCCCCCYYNHHHYQRAFGLSFPLGVPVQTASMHNRQHTNTKTAKLQTGHEVGMEHSIQVFICHALEETVLDDAGIVDQDLAPAESNSSAEKLFAAFSIAHIQLQREHLVISVKYKQCVHLCRYQGSCCSMVQSEQ